MANTPTVQFDLLDKTRELRFDINAFSDIEDRAKCGIGAMLEEDRIGFSTIRLMVWGGLKWQDRRLSIEQTGILLQEYMEKGGNMEEVMKVVTDAIMKSGLMGQEGESGNGQAEGTTNPSSDSPTG